MHSRLRRRLRHRRLPTRLDPDTREIELYRLGRVQ